MKLWIIAITILVSTFRAEAQKKKRTDQLITLSTSLGTTHIVLYDETPLHKANFLKLVKSKFYDSLLFHIVIENFMIQGGDPNSKNSKSGASLDPSSIKSENIPFEFTPLRVHKKGALAALAATRNNNPEKKSSPSQFYIVQGKKLDDGEIAKVEKSNGITYSNKQKADYVAIGGTPALDNKYTVFGEMLDNFDLIDKIATTQKDEYNRPVIDIKMFMKAKKMRRKKISKKYKYSYL